MEKESENNNVSGKGNINYIPPKIELLEIVVEKGFADSTTDFGNDTW